MSTNHQHSYGITKGPDMETKVRCIIAIVVAVRGSCIDSLVYDHIRRTHSK